MGFEVKSPFELWWTYLATLIIPVKNDCFFSSTYNVSNCGSNMEVKQFVLKLSRVLCLVLPELVTYLVAYYAVNIAYRSIGPEYNDEEGILTRLVAYFNTNGQNLARDLTFLLGFYVATVAKRWWAQSVLPVPDNLVLFLSGVVLQGPTQDHQRNLHLKRTVIRYENWAL